MRISSCKEDFWEHLDNAFPRPMKLKDQTQQPVEQMELNYDGPEPLEFTY
jgi:hypothetical protein